MPIQIKKTCKTKYAYKCIHANDYHQIHTNDSRVLVYLIEIKHNKVIFATQKK